ncbi:hypothetical protein NMG60_11005878 [Bertholletia excelsa]
MEKEKKRKRSEADEVVGNRGGHRNRKEMEKPEKAEADPTATDEEVDEFFTILRRIQVAVKYFSKSNGDAKGDCNRDGREKLPDRDVEGEGVRENGAFDLNAMPDAESV